jgi:adenylate cyclase
LPKLVPLGGLTFDEARSCLQGPAGPVALRRKSFEVLHYLVDHAERVVPKDELLDAVWAGVTVGEDSLAQCVTEIRRALGPTGRDAIKTVPRRGYLLRVPAPSLDASAPRGAGAPDALPLPDRPSIAVLPFANLGGQAQDDYFSDGIAEDIITELSRFSELFVIARNSSFQYNGKSIDVRQIGRELGVRYVLEGSVRRDASRVRITAQLVDAATGIHIWAERYDRGLADALSVQDEVARRIVTVLAVRVRKAESERVLAKPPTVWQAYDYYLQAADCVTAYHSSYDREALFRGRRLLQQALATDPTYARALAALSSCYMSQWVHRWDDDCPWTEALDRSYQTARESVRLAPELPEAHIALGQALTFLRQHEAAITAVERATALNPNLTSFRFAYTYILAGAAARATQLLGNHMRLDPFYEPNAPTALGFAYYMLARYGEALPYLQEAVSRAPDMAHGRYVLAMAHARLGELDKARAEVAHALRLEPWYRISQSLTARYFKRAEDTEHLVTGLRMAGFPE